MKTKILAAMVLGLVVHAGVRADDTTSWEKFSPATGGFRILLPGSPITQTKTMPTPVGPAKMTMYTASAEEGSRIYMVGFVVFPLAIPGSEADEVLDGFAQGVVQPIKGKVISKKDITLGDNKGKEIEIELLNGELVGRARVYVVKDRMYAVKAMAPKDNADTKEFEKFLDSFELTEAR